jgi:3-hydroxyisobutyrate dehydrogenase-like beta-hydroxyacid dehydrogenase
MRIAVIGLGEAGSLIAADLVKAAQAVTGYDPANVPTPSGIVRHDRPTAAVRDADVVIALTAARDARTAIEQTLADIPPTALYADFSTSSAGLKRELATVAAGRNLPFVDVALVGIVPGNGLCTPALASGSGAARFVAMFRPLGMPVELVSEVAGDAATRKLLRSVVMKGLAGTVIEALRGAEQAGCADWLWNNLAADITNADASFLARLVRGTQLHAARRLEEMEAAAALLGELGVEPLLTRGAVENLRGVPREGIPTIPDR